MTKDNVVDVNFCLQCTQRDEMTYSDLVVRAKGIIRSQPIHEQRCTANGFCLIWFFFFFFHLQGDCQLFNNNHKIQDGIDCRAYTTARIQPSGALAMSHALNNATHFKLFVAVDLAVAPEMAFGPSVRLIYKCHGYVKQNNGKTAQAYALNCV